MTLSISDVDELNTIRGSVCALENQSDMTD
jgi:hypothetical protein